MSSPDHVDPTDYYDLEAVRWREDREADRADRGDLHGIGRPVVPFTFADMRAEKAAAGAAEAAKYAAVFAAPTDITHGDRWGTVA